MSNIEKLMEKVTFPASEKMNTTLPITTRLTNLFAPELKTKL